MVYNNHKVNTGYGSGSLLRLLIRRLLLYRRQLPISSMASAAPGRSLRPVTAFQKYRQGIWMDPACSLLRSRSGWIPLLSLLLQMVFFRTGSVFSFRICIRSCGGFLAMSLSRSMTLWRHSFIFHTGWLCAVIWRLHCFNVLWFNPHHSKPTIKACNQ